MAGKLEKLYLNAGQMKAGTTYLYSILRPHTGIFFSPEKELHYLSQRFGHFRILGDHVRLRKAKSFTEIANKLDRPLERYRESLIWAANYLRDPKEEGWYESMFEGRRPDQWAADFSNLTCTIPVDGLRQVRDMAGQVRVTYCIRDAVSRAISHAKFHLRFAGKEHDLAALPEAQLRKLLASDNIMPQSQSEAHIAALHEVFGDEGLRIIRCETLWDRPEAVVSDLCRFLDLDPLPGTLRRDAVNVGPSSKMNAEVEAIFEDIFAPIQARNEALLDRYAHLVIGG